MLRVALVGCGVMGRRHAEVVRSDAEARLVAAVDTVPERAEAIARSVSGCRTSAQGVEIDLVIVATPTDTHVEVARPWLERGAWVLVEKPVAATLAEARSLAHPRVLVGHCERFNPAVRAGRVQGPTELTMERLSPYTGRGIEVDVIADLMVHDLDLLLRWAPSLQVVDAQGSTGPSGSLDRVTAQLRGEGLDATVTSDRMAARRHRVVAGHDAVGPLRLDLASGEARRGDARQPPIDAHDALSAQWHAVRGHIEGRGGAVAEPEAALAVLALAESIRARVQQGRGVA